MDRVNPRTKGSGRPLLGPAPNQIPRPMQRRKRDASAGEAGHDRTSTPHMPERAIACAVLRHAVSDVTDKGVKRDGKFRVALRWLTATSGEDYVWRTKWCDMAGLNREYFDRKVRVILTRKGLVR